jgi:hypothetical protein
VAAAASPAPSAAPAGLLPPAAAAAATRDKATKEKTSSDAVSGHSAPNYARECIRMLYLLTHQLPPYWRDFALRYCFVLNETGLSGDGKGIDGRMEEQVVALCILSL